MGKKGVLFLCIMTLVLISKVWSDNLKLELVGNDPFGPANAVYMDNDYAYLVPEDH